MKLLPYSWSAKECVPTLTMKCMRESPGLPVMVSAFT